MGSTCFTTRDIARGHQANLSVHGVLSDGVAEDNGPCGPQILHPPIDLSLPRVPSRHGSDRQARAATIRAPCRTVGRPCSARLPVCWRTSSRSSTWVASQTTWQRKICFPAQTTGALPRAMYKAGANRSRDARGACRVSMAGLVLPAYRGATRHAHSVASSGLATLLALEVPRRTASDSARSPTVDRHHGPREPTWGRSASRTNFC